MPKLHHGDLDLLYREAGAGESVLLLHGSAGSGAQWRRLGRRLQPRCHVLAPDLIGYGGSSAWPQGRAFDLAAEMAPLEALLMERPGEPAGDLHLVGYSYGGAVALGLALAHSARLRSLTLIEPVAFALLRELGQAAAYAEVAGFRHRFTRLLSQGDTPAAMRDFLDYWSGPGSFAALPEEALPALFAAAPKIACDLAATFGAAFTIEALSGLRVPTLVLGGDRSPLATQASMRAVAGAIAGCEVITLPGAGHDLPLTHAEAVEAAIAAHVTAWLRPAGG